MRAVLLACVMLGLGACASQPRDEAAAKKAAEATCLRETGTRIKHKEEDRHCVHGEVLSAEDLERSGVGSISEALNRRMTR